MKSSNRKRLIPLNKLMKKAQVIFNAWIRERDAKKLNGICYTCPERGNQAGHFRHNNNATRFSEIFVNLQGPKCNLYLSGNLGVYAINLIKEHGQETVDKLLKESYRTKTFSRKDLEAIIKKYSPNRLKAYK